MGFLVFGLALALSIPLTLNLLSKQQDIRQRAAGNLQPPSFIPVNRYAEDRVDRNGDGVYESYWELAIKGGKCAIILKDLNTQNQIWTGSIDNCYGMDYGPIFHWRSFMGDPARDFTVVVKDSTGNFLLRAGDGATGILRNFSYYLNTPSSGFGNATVDFKIPGYPGPALIVRSLGGPKADFHGHLFYFPQETNGFEDLTDNPNVINKKLFEGNPFPGLDLPNSQFTSIYNNFNAPERCTVITETGNANNPPICSIIDNGTGQGIFHGSIAVADIDGDGVEDVDMTYFFKSGIYPGRPKGSIANLGAPQYDFYYNPQNDNSACHGGRHYGANILVNIDADPYLEQIDIGGIAVGNFRDLWQNVSRNVGVIDSKIGTSGFYRSLLFNHPHYTAIPPSCSVPSNPQLAYQHALHIPGDGLIKSSDGKAKLIQINLWNEASQNNETCAHLDTECYKRVADTQIGYWAWALYNPVTGASVSIFPNTYVWGLVPASPTTLWAIYSSSANVWNLGTVPFRESPNDPVLIYRSDLKIGLFDTQTLSMTNVTSISIPAQPFIRPTRSQQLSGNLFLYNTGRIYTLPIPGSSYPGIVLRKSDGYVIYAHDGTGWVLSGNYNTGGKLYSPTISTAPTATPTPTAVYGPNILSANISPNPVKTNGISQHNITITTNDRNGSGIVEQQAVINYQGPNAGLLRGRLIWAKTTNWSAISSAPPLPCTNGGFAVSYQSASYGYSYLNLVSCKTTVLGSSRTTIFVVSFNTNFTTPIANNTLSGYSRDGKGMTDGWRAFETFNLATSTIPTTTPTPTRIPTTTPTRIPTPTATPVNTPTLTPTPTTAPTPTRAPTGTLIPTPTPTNTPNNTPTPFPTEMQPSPSPTSTITNSCPLKKNGDANCDGSVNTDDFNIWRDELLGGSQAKKADFNGDNTVNTDDFNIWRDGLLNGSLPH